MLKNLSKKSKGFTLVELLIVIGIIATLFVIFLPKIDFATNKARETGIRSDFRSFQIGAEQMLREYAGLPDKESIDGDTNIDTYNTYLDSTSQFKDGKSALSDPWTRPYEINIEGSKEDNNYKIFITSLGRTKGDDIDYVLLVEYKEGQILAATGGLNNNLGEDYNEELESGDKLVNTGATCFITE